MPVLSAKVHKARKHYFCGGCDRSICVGELYTRLFGNGDGEPMHELKLCERCRPVDTPLPSDDGYDYVRRHYGVPVFMGQRVVVGDVEGKVVRNQEGDQYIWVKADKWRGRANCHPTYQMQYYDRDGTTLLLDTREPVAASAS